MKILVPIRRVTALSLADSGRIPSSTDDLEAIEWTINPFDAYALECALRLTENGQSPKMRAGTVVVVTFGCGGADDMLRAALNIGADESICIDPTGIGRELDDALVLRALTSTINKHKPDIVIMGKPASEDDPVGQALAESLGWSLVTCVSTIQEEADNTFLVGHAVDGDRLTIHVRTPVVIAVDPGIVSPTSVYSCITAPTFQYKEGVRSATLANTMASKRKSKSVVTFADLEVAVD